MWTSKNHSRRKVKLQLERLDQRAVPATFGGPGFGGVYFSGPATAYSGALGFNTPVSLSHTQSSLAAGNLFGARQAFQRSGFGAFSSSGYGSSAFSNRPFYSSFNSSPVRTFPAGGGFYGIQNTPGGVAGLQGFGLRGNAFNSLSRYSPLTAGGFGTSAAMLNGGPSGTLPTGNISSSGGYYGFSSTPGGGMAGLL